MINNTATPESDALSLHDALPIFLEDAYPNFSICGIPYYVSGEVTHWRNLAHRTLAEDRKSTRLNSSHVEISYAVFCLKIKRKMNKNHTYEISKSVVIPLGTPATL